MASIRWLRYTCVCCTMKNSDLPIHSAKYLQLPCLPRQMYFRIAANNSLPSAQCLKAKQWHPDCLACHHCLRKSSRFEPSFNIYGTGEKSATSSLCVTPAFTITLDPKPKFKWRPFSTRLSTRMYCVYEKLQLQREPIGKSAQKKGKVSRPQNRWTRKA